jgi:hypothetical protein
MEDLGIIDVAQIISTIGFPAFVAVWLLYYGKKQQEKMTEALTDLKLEVQLTRKFVEHFINKDKKEVK